MSPAETITEKNWGAEEWRQPKEHDGDTVLYSECGRVLDRVDYRSHWFKLVNGQYGGYALLVKHGGGEERVQLGYNKRIAAPFFNMDSDARYLLLYQFLSIYHDAKRAAEDATAKLYRTAFAEDRLKKRKQRGQDAVKVWIEAKT